MTDTDMIAMFKIAVDKCSIRFKCTQTVATKHVNEEIKQTISKSVVLSTKPEVVVVAKVDSAQKQNKAIDPLFDVCKFLRA